MRGFIAIAKKEFFHILRDSRTMVLLFVIPVVLVILFGYAIRTEISDAPLTILNKSGDQLSTKYISKIFSTDYFQYAGAIHVSAEIEKSFQSGSTKAVLVIPADFQEKFAEEGKESIQLILDATDPNTATTLRNYINAITADFQREQMGSQAVKNRVVQARSRMLFNPTLESTYYFVPGVITIILALVSAMMTSVTLAREKEMGTMRLLGISPLNSISIISGKTIPYFVLAFLDAVIILALGNLLFHVPVRGSMVLILSICILFILTNLALGIFISTIVSTQRLALLISLLGLFLPTILLSGFIFPIESMPIPLQWLSHIAPAKWFIRILKDLMLKGSGMDIIWSDSVVLIGMLAVFLILSIVNFVKGRGA